MSFVFKLLVFIFFITFIFVAVTFYNVINDPQQDHVSSETAAHSLERTIKQIKFEISDVKAVGSKVPKWSNDFDGNVTRLSAKTFDMLDELLLSVVDNNFPVIISNSVAVKWGALLWDLWDLALPEKWPVLNKVLTLDTKFSGSGIFVMNDEKSEGGTLGAKCNDCSSLESPLVIPEMYLADFLFDLKNNTCKHFYSTNYRVVETIAKVTFILKLIGLVFIMF
jgi:hypothetical protein